MLPLENESKLEQESKGKTKTFVKRKVIRLRLALFGSVAFFFILLSPVTLQVIGNFCKPRIQNKFFSHILQKSTDLLWVYGYYGGTLFNYRYLYENIDERLNLELVQESLYSLAITYYHMQDYITAKLLYRIFKARWPNIKKIDNRFEFHSVEGDLLEDRKGLMITPPEWILDLADKYGVPY